MKQKFKIFYVTPKVYPFAQMSDVAEVCGSFPKTLKNLGHDIRVMMPNYRSVNERRYVLRDVIRLQGLQIKLGEESFDASGKSAFIPESKVQIYFLDNKELFGQETSVYDAEAGPGQSENAKRFVFFSLGCLETLKLLYWQPDIIHCNDWQTALVPFLLKTVYKDDEFFKDCKTLLSIHNPARQGIFDQTVVESAGVPQTGLVAAAKGRVSFLQTGIQYADFLNITNEAVAEEVSGDSDPVALRAAIKERSGEIFAINNGIDGQIWDPETDKSIHANYSHKEPAAKLENKGPLLEHFGITKDSPAPIFSTYSAFIDVNSVEQFLDTVKELVSRDLHFLSLGPGIDSYLKGIQVLHEKYPDKIVFDATGDLKLLHLAGAGSDFFLVPSCSVFGGLAPMCFLTYGTIPLVPNLPVFRDFVMDMDSENSNGNGVVFDQASPAGIVSGIDRAIAAYADKESWKKNIETAMGKDFSWQAPTHEYLKLYQKLVSGKVRP